MNPAPAQDRSALLARARHGDEESLGRLLQSYRNYLNLVARTQINLHLTVRVNPSDVVQETYLQAWRRFDQFRGETEAELLSWLRRILVRNIIEAFQTHLKSQKRDVRRQRPLERVARVLVPADGDQGCGEGAPGLRLARCEPGGPLERRDRRFPPSLLLERCAEVGPGDR